MSKASSDKKAAHITLKTAENNPNTTEVELSIAATAFSNARKAFRRITRRTQALADNTRDEQIHEILSKDPSNAFKLLKNSKSSTTSKIYEVKVGDSTYSGENQPRISK